ncbi:MAG: urease accessory protein UreF [Beijerinckiaceae bacterium]
MGTTMVAIMSNNPALLLQNWLSPSFPVGSFAYSHGLEFAIHAQHVKNKETCREWIADLIQYGSWRNDAILSGAAWEAISTGEAERLESIIELALALAPSRERHLESVQQGNAFMTAIKTCWLHKHLAPIKSLHVGDIPYSVALGACAALYGVPRSSTVAAYGMSFAQTLVSAALRLSIIGHTDGQYILASLLPTVSEAADSIKDATLDDLGSSTMLSDICSLQHETQFTRFFRS